MIAHPRAAMCAIVLSALLFAGCGSAEEPDAKITAPPAPSASASSTATPTDPEESKNPDDREYELVKGKSYTPVLPDGAAGELEILGIRIDKNCDAFDDGDACIWTDAKITNIGMLPFAPHITWDAFESDDGQVLDTVAAFCREDDFPSAELDEGQFGVGCFGADVPSEALPGRLILKDASGQTFFVRVS